MGLDVKSPILDRPDPAETAADGKYLRLDSVHSYRKVMCYIDAIGASGALVGMDGIVGTAEVWYWLPEDCFGGLNGTGTC